MGRDPVTGMLVDMVDLVRGIADGRLAVIIERPKVNVTSKDLRG